MPKEYMNPENYTDDRSLCEGLYFAHLDLSHTSPDWDNILKLGITGLIERAEAQLADDNTPFSQSIYLLHTYNSSPFLYFMLFTSLNYNPLTFLYVSSVTNSVFNHQQ